MNKLKTGDTVVLREGGARVINNISVSKDKLCPYVLTWNSEGRTEYQSYRQDGQYSLFDGPHSMDIVEIKNKRY